MVFTKEYRYFAFYVFLSFSALIAIYVSGVPKLVETVSSVPVEFKIEAGDFYSNAFHIRQVSPKLQINLDVTGSVMLKVGDVIKPCGHGRCAHIFNLLGAKQIVPFEIYSQNGAAIHRFDYRVVKYKSETTMSQVFSSRWTYVGILFALTLFVNYRFYSKRVINQWLLIGLAFAFLGVNDWLFSLVLISFLGAMHALRKWISGEQSSRRLWGVILLAVSFLLLWKYGKETLYEPLDSSLGLSYFMPIGVSYFVIRLIDTLLRWYRGELVDISFREFLLFIIFPGTLLAGPIENLKDFYANRCARLQWDDLGSGLSRIIIGLAKKFVLADGLLYPAIHGAYGVGIGVDALILDTNAAQGFDIMAFAIFGLFYAYIDFSAYSDIAIGISRLFGYRICENFNIPIFASNIREYWKRWHMSLSNWAFRNIYFPVLVQTRNSYLPLYMTMLLIGLWHAFSFSWFAWAIHHASGMGVVAVFQKRFPQVSRSKNKLLNVLSIGATVIYASMGFVFVYLDDFSVAIELYLSYWKFIFLFWA